LRKGRGHAVKRTDIVYSAILSKRLSDAQGLRANEGVFKKEPPLTLSPDGGCVFCGCSDLLSQMPTDIKPPLWGNWCHECHDSHDRGLSLLQTLLGRIESKAFSTYNDIELLVAITHELIFPTDIAIVLNLCRDIRARTKSDKEYQRVNTNKIAICLVFIALYSWHPEFEYVNSKTGKRPMLAINLRYGSQLHMPEQALPSRLRNECLPKTYADSFYRERYAWAHTLAETVAIRQSFAPVLS
jgi:hypothetical protein